MTRRTVAAVAVVVLSFLAGSPAGASGSAIRPDNKPTPLAGAENGRVPDGRLITVAPGCRVAREAGPSLALLFRTAHESGVDLTGRDCYRPVAGQVAESQQWSAAGNSACAATPARGPGGQVTGTSNHGWGKAVDFGDPGSLSFSSTGYRFLKAQAARFGWNHPGWAEPGGSACPEAWHWEWVGDGGTLGGDPIAADVVAVLPAPGDAGYDLVSGLGAVRSTGGAPTFGAADTTPLQWVVVGATATPSRQGYWLVAGDGGIFSFGDATFFGSTGAMRLNAPIVGMASTLDGRGYWLVASDGGVFTFGTAPFRGSAADAGLREPAVGLVATLGGGYRIAAADGTVVTR